MSVGRRTDCLLSAPVTLRLISLAAARAQSPDELGEALRLLESASISRTHNTMELLGELGIISIEGGSVAVSLPSTDAAGIAQFVGERLLAQYLGVLASAPVGSLFQLRPDEDDLWVDRLQLPGRERGLPYALLEFGVFHRDTHEDRFWRISPGARGAFLQLIDQINHSTATQMSLRGLKALQRAREEAGWRAEQFVVSFEKAVRSRHPLANSIRSISMENVSAGFDVLSFETDTALIHDKFIEVKSFEGVPTFYWSAGEIAAALEFQERYWLYLVDRAQISVEGYFPDMIQNPYAYFIERSAHGWEREEQGYKFTSTA